MNRGFLEDLTTTTADWLKETSQKIVDKVTEASDDNPNDSDLEARLLSVVAITKHLADAARDTVKTPVRPPFQVERLEID